ncbi:DUF308 domain-containing protein [Sulfurimonas sp. HSL3-7]|uniref:DUF308 domain-containing protein n=1 Tax=Sulfonitrofixus jiaomeiensis TaxID=3131938 RepID=UPI0031FA0FAD
MSDDYESKSRWIGTLFIIIGIIAGVYASFSTFAPATVISATMVVSGLISFFLTKKLNPDVLASRIKTHLLILFGLLFLLLPYGESGTARVIATAYFLGAMSCDLFFASMTRKNRTAFAWLANALFSALFAYLVAFQTFSAKAIGIFIALTLIFDGLSVLYSGRKIFIRP